MSAFKAYNQQNKETFMFDAFFLYQISLIRKKSKNTKMNYELIYLAKYRVLPIKDVK